MKAFKAYDIRGVYNRDFTRDDVYKIGFWIPRLLEADSVLVGRDVRESSEEIFSSLVQGICDSGADAVSIGLSTTPKVYYLTAKLGFRASVMITASHNSKEYNGMKISRENALPVGSDSGLKELEQMMLTRAIDPVQEHKRGTLIEYVDDGAYLNFLRQYLPDLSSLNVTIDCSNGMANLLVKDLFGDAPHYLFDEYDGTFPNHEPNPLIEENLEDLKRAVLANKSDLGVIYDGDADRVMFVDEEARFIQPDLIIAVLGRSFLKDAPAVVLQDIRTSRSVTEYLQKLGAEVHTWKVGHSFAKRKMRELDALFGGELAGHYYFRDFFYCDSGFLASLIVLKTAADLKAEGRTFSSLIDEIVRYHTSGEINFHIERKSEAMEALKEHYTRELQPEKIMDFDGYRIEFPDWWFNVRPSNTEPYLRLVVEARTRELLNEKLAELNSILDAYH